MLDRILEAILFAAGEPLGPSQFALAVPEVPEEEIVAALEVMREKYDREGRGFRLEFIAGGWQLLSNPELFPYVEKFLEGKRRARLSRAALETLAVIAYRQPVTRGELEELRGVDCGGVLQTLMERDFITIRGRSKAIGRPLIYGSTEHFLEHFGLASLAELPRLEELETLWSADEVRQQIEEELERRLAAIGGNGGNGGGGSGSPAPAQQQSVAAGAPGPEGGDSGEEAVQ